MTSNVLRENDKAIINNVHGWFLGNKESSPHATLEIVLDGAGEKIDYNYLMGVSSQAFRIQVSTTGFCGSSPHAACGFNCMDRLKTAIPYEQISMSCKPEDTAKVHEIRKRIMQSIDKGIAVRYGSEESGVIVGYQKDGEEWIAYHYFVDGGTKQFTEKNWPWGFDFYERKSTPLSSRKALGILAIQQAVEMANTPEVKGYYVGFNAWAKVIERLEALEKADEKSRNDVMTGNSWLYECLASYRGSAADYLRQIASDFPEKSRKHLLSAADNYEKISKEILTGKECVLSIAPTQWSLKEGESWTPQMRAEEIKRLKAAFEVEKSAIGELTLALKNAVSPDQN